MLPRALLNMHNQLFKLHIYTVILSILYHHPFYIQQQYYRLVNTSFCTSVLEVDFFYFAYRYNVLGTYIYGRGVLVHIYSVVRILFCFHV